MAAFQLPNERERERGEMYITKAHLMSDVMNAINQIKKACVRLKRDTGSGGDSSGPASG